MRFVMVVVVVMALLIAACGGGGGAKVVKVSLREWDVGPAVEEVTEGKVKFEVTNEGSTPHEFVVVKSDLPPEGLPVKDGKVVEDQVNLVDEIEAFAAGTTQSLTLELSPGKYLLICNIVEQVPGERVTSHYQNGMVAFFLVEPK